ncbi:MAG: hypothetical protein EOO10_13780 [Chitinophagaceae bacterium]|nr:MAG: hypothetical protein EOO10_13780 [Chitinophagaceae bacterium]
MKKFLILLTAAVVLYQCTEKDIEGDFAGKEYVRGRLFINDTLTQQSVGVPLAKKKVSLGYADSPDSLNFLFTTTTDEEGYFLFQNLRSDKIYRLYYEEKVGDVLYIGKDTVQVPSNQKPLFAEVALNKQSGMQFTVSDPTGGRIKGAKICVFLNASSYVAGACDASNFQLTTDDYGRASKLNISPGTYYILASFSAGTTTLTRKDTVVVSSRVEQRTLQLQPGTTKNGVTYLVLDSTGARLSGVSLCFFTSPVLFSRDTCEGSNFQLLSNNNGVATQQDIAQNKYYVYGYLKVGDIAFAGKDTLQVSSSMLSDTIILRRK